MLVLFDLDGTLTDPFAGIAAGIRHACSRLGRPAPSDEVVRSMIGPPFQETFGPVLGVPSHQVDEGIAHYRSVYETGGLYDAILYDGIESVVTAVRAAGHRVALATSKPADSAARVLAHFRLDHLFHFIGGASRDRSRTHKHEVIAHVLAQLGTSGDDAVMVGDRRYDVDGARHNGVPCIGVRWGYAEAGELEAAAPTRIVDNATQLQQALL